jgi:hypothetical protein
MRRVLATELREGEVVMILGRKAWIFDLFIGHRYVHFMTVFGSQRVPKESYVEVYE